MTGPALPPPPPPPPVPPPPVPRPPVPPPIVAEQRGRSGGRRRTFVAIGVMMLVVAVGVGVALTAEDEGGDETLTTAGARERPDAGPLLIALNVPDGWAVSDDELAVAENPGDFAALYEPSGPVAFVDEDLDGRTPAELVESFVIPEGGSAPAEANVLVGEVEELEVDGESAVAVTMLRARPNLDGTTEGAPGWVTRYVTVHPRKAPPVTFVLVVPYDRFEAAEADVDSVPGFSRSAGVPIPGADEI